jgi:two-component system, response regulator PdtaR
LILQGVVVNVPAPEGARVMAPAEQPNAVLVVEDEPLVRALAVDVLEEAGFHVLEAATADYALVVLEKREDICVLLTDVDMPGRLNGFQLARIVQDHFHRVRVVIVSGKARPDAGDIAPDAIFIPKPYKLSEIVRTVEALSGRSMQ